MADSDILFAAQIQSKERILVGMSFRSFHSLSIMFKS